MRTTRLPSRTAILAVLLAAASPLLGGPLEILSPAPSALAGSEQMVLLVLEVGPEGVRSLGTRVAPGRPKMREIERPGSEYVFTLLDAEGSPLLIGGLEVDFTLHGDDLVDEDGTLQCISVELERVQVVLKLPIVPGYGRLLFHRLEDPAAWDQSAFRALLGAGDRSLAGVTEVGEIDLAAEVRHAR